MQPIFKHIFSGKFPYHIVPNNNYSVHQRDLKALKSQLSYAVRSRILKNQLKIKTYQNSITKFIVVIPLYLIVLQEFIYTFTNKDPKLRMKQNCSKTPKLMFKKQAYSKYIVKNSLLTNNDKYKITLFLLEKVYLLALETSKPKWVNHDVI